MAIRSGALQFLNSSPAVDDLIPLLIIQSILIFLEPLAALPRRMRAVLCVQTGVCASYNLAIAGVDNCPRPRPTAAKGGVEATWAWQDFRLKISQISFLTFATPHHKFRETFYLSVWTQAYPTQSNTVRICLPAPLCVPRGRQSKQAHPTARSLKRSIRAARM